MSKKKKRKKYAIHFGDDNFTVNGVILNEVHEYPGPVWMPEQEIDFYMDNGNDIFLLRLRNNKKNQVSFIKNKYDCIMMIIVETPISGEKLRVLEPIIQTVQQIIATQDIELKNNFSLTFCLY